VFNLSKGTVVIVVYIERMVPEGAGRKCAVQNFNKESSVAQKGFIGWDFDMCFRKLSFFKTKTLL